MQLALWTIARERFNGVTCGHIVPELGSRANTFFITTEEATRMIHRLQRRLPRRLQGWAILRLLPRRWGLTDDVRGVLPPADRMLPDRPIQSDRTNS